jgi:hypothetical protein
MNKAIIQHLSQDFIEGKRMLDSQYDTIVNTTANKLKLISKDKGKIKALITEIGPCTIITYKLYYDIIRKTYPKEITNNMILTLLETINDIKFFVSKN